MIQANNRSESSVLACRNTTNEESKVNERISKLENEVAHLINKGGEDGKLINQLTGRIERLEASSKKCDCDKAKRMRLKRPVRLLPSMILR